MGWEERPGGRYYYQKRRIGKRVVSEYAGNGSVAELIAAYQATTQQLERSLSDRLQAERSQERAIDGQVEQVCALARMTAGEVLEQMGYHRHKGQWRRRRR